MADPADLLHFGNEGNRRSGSNLHDVAEAFQPRRALSPQQPREPRPRLRRFLLENHAYHVTTATKDRAPTLSEPRAANVVLDAVQFLRKDRALVLAYCVMPDHAHVLMVPRAPFTLPQVVQTLKGFTSRKLNAAMGRRGALWQQSYYDRLIRSEKQLMAAIDYIEENPVKARLAVSREAYEFSSAGRAERVDLVEYLGGAPAGQVPESEVITGI